MFEPTVREEVHIVREVLEGAFSPQLATQVMFEALQQSGAVPGSTEEVLHFCRTGLASVVEEMVGADVREIVLQRLEQVLVKGDRTGTDIPIEVDLDDDSVTMVMPTVWRQPVSVLVLAGTPHFATQLHAALGDGRVHVTTVDGEEDTRRAVFSSAPLIVMVDATAPPSIDRGTIATTLRSLPDNVLPVVWGRETEYGDGLEQALQAAGVTATISLRYGHGIGPLLDLVQARYTS